MEHYVYIHKDPITHEIRYVGKGSGIRAGQISPSARSGYHLNWIKSLNKKGLKPIIEKLFFFETKQEALNKEIALIKEYRRLGYRLTNLTDGGECGSGLFGKDHPWYGKRLPAVDAVMAPIICLTTGEKFNSLTEAANSYGLTVSKISLVCSLKRKHTGGYVFRYVGEEHLEFKKRKCGTKKGTIPSNRKPIMLIELNKVFSNIYEAVEFCIKQGRATNRAAIRRTARGIYKTAAGYTWSFV